MSFDFEINWDEPEDLDLTGLGGAFPDWGLLKLVCSKHIQLFAKGQTLTIPEIVINGQPWSRNGIKEGGSTKALFFTLQGVNSKTGEPFTSVRFYTNRPQWEIEDASRYPHIYLTDEQKKLLAEKGKLSISDWTNLQKPAMQAVLGKRINDLSTTGLWVKADNTNYSVRDSNQLNDDGTPKKYYEKYWSNFVVFDSEAAMNAAKADEVVLSNGITYPDGWGSSVDAMLDYIAGQIAPNSDFDTKVVEWKLAGSDHVKAILKEAVNRKDAIPPAKAEIMAAIEAWEEKPF